MNIQSQNLENLKLKGIYRILNTENNKCYVGSTWKSFQSRLTQHLSKLNCKKHHCHHLQSAWDKYGEDIFQFEILEVIDNKDILLDREKYFIEKFDSYLNGYNENPDPNFSPMYNENSKIKSSETHKKIWENLRNSMTEEEFEQYRKEYAEHRGKHKGAIPWNKGVKMTEEQTKNMKKPKINGISEAMKEVHKKNSQLAKDRADYVLVYDSNKKWINTFWCNSDLVEYSKSEFNDLPMKLRNNGTRTLDPSKIANHIKDGKAYKGLYFVRAPKSWKLSYANGMNSWKAESEPIMSQAEDTSSEGAETTGEV